MFKAVVCGAGLAGRSRTFRRAGTFAVLLSAASAGFSQQFSIATVAGGAPPATPTSATAASIGKPQRVAVDKAGNLYFTSLNCVFRVGPGGGLTLVAGNSRPGFSGDGGAAVNAQLNSPQGIAVDPAGNVYIADSGNNRVRLVSADGTISTVAGNGLPGTYGSVGNYLAKDANLNLPAGVALDSKGNLYIADTGHHAVRMVDAQGIITMIAGDTYPGYSGDKSAANKAELRSPRDVAVDSNGNVFIADTGNSVVRKIGTDGNITTFAGNGSQGFSGDKKDATKATMTEPFGVAVDSAGNVYIAEASGERIRKVDTAGIIDTLSGDGVLGFAGDGGQASGARYALPTGLAVDASGNLYVADSLNLRIRKIASGGTVSTVAGNGVFSYSGNGGPALKAQMNDPAGVAVDSAGNVYVSDTANNVVRKIDASGVISTVAGNGSAGFAGDGGNAGASQLAAPAGLALDSAGNLYIADTQNNRVRRLGTDNRITTVAGSGTPGYSGDGAAATAAQLNSPYAVAVDSANNLYIADFGNSRVRKVSPNGTISTLAGTGVWGFSGDEGPAAGALINGPQGVAVDAAGNVYIADTNNNRVRRVSSDGVITTIAGNGSAGFSGDLGPANGARVGSPTAVAVDANGVVYVTSGNARIRAVYQGVIVTVAGNGSTGYAGDGGSAASAQFDSPSAMAVDASGNIFIADSGNNAVRVLRPSSAADIAIAAVTNSASNLIGAVAPGEIVTLYGSGMGPADLVTMELDFTGKVSRSLAGTTVYVNGSAAPMVYTSANQVAAVIPYSVAGSPSAQIFVQYQGRTSAPFNVSVTDAAPALFTLDASGQGQAAAINKDGSNSVNGPNRPIKTGSYVELYLTGSGQTNPPVQDGSISAAPLPLPVLPVTVTVGGKDATVTYAGAAPGSVAGLTQVNIQIPTGITPGAAVPVVVKVGSVTTPSGVTIAVAE